MIHMNRQLARTVPYRIKPIFARPFFEEKCVNFSQFNLNNNIEKAIVQCGYTQPTPIQAQAIPLVLAGKDVVASAQTGTGKTAAFVLPTLNRISETTHTNKKTRVLVLTPTRELAAQVTKSAVQYGKYLPFKMVSIVGGMSYHHQIRDLARGADILVATPGRLIDHLNSNRIDLSAVEMLILDEADRMLDMGFIDDVQYIAQLTPKNRQTLLFSATLDNKLMAETKHLLNHPVRIDLSQEKMAAPQIKQEMYRVSSAQQKNRLLQQFLTEGNIYKAIIFSATKINAERLADDLQAQGFEAAALHGDLKQNVRNRTLQQLRQGKVQFLVATDVAARGIDISDITHVINYDLPRFCEDYVHRIGRTGRAGKEGVAISFVLPADFKHLQRIERYIGQRLQLLHVSADGSVKAEEKSDRQKPVIRNKSEFKHRAKNSERFERNDKEGRFKRKFAKNETTHEKRRDSGHNKDTARNKTDAKFDQPRKVMRKAKSQDDRFERKAHAAPKKKSWANDSSAPRGDKNKWRKRANDK